MAYHTGDLSSARAAFLKTNGYSGSTNDMLLAWLAHNGSTAKDLNGAWRQFFVTAGATGSSFNDLAYSYLSGVTGLVTAAASHALSDLWREYWAGSYGPT